MTSLSSRPNPVLRRLLLLFMILSALAGAPPAGFAATDDAGLAAQILPSDPPRLELQLPVPAAHGAAAAMIAIDIDQPLVAGGVLDAALPTGIRFRPLPSTGRITLDAGGVAGWSVFQARPAARRTFRIVVANHDPALSGSAPAAAAPAAPLRLVLPLAEAGKSLAVTVRTGSSLASLGPPRRLAVAVPVLREQVVFRALGGQALTALDVGDRITLSWTARDCVSATLSGPLDYGNAVQTLNRGPDGTCEGTRTVVVMGPATFVFKALVPEKPGGSRNLLVERAITVDVRRLEQFASLLLTPAAVLPGGDVTVRWHLRDLAGGDRRTATLAWTDISGNDRVQRLPLVKGETNSGSFSFAAANLPAGSRAGTVRLFYGAEGIERNFDIVQWQARDGAFGDGAGSPARRGMAYAGGHLLVCTEKGIFAAPVADAIADGVGTGIAPFPSLTRRPLRETDPLPAPGAPAPGGGNDRRDLAREPCFAIIALNAREALAILRIDPGVGVARPDTAYAEMVVLRPAEGLAGKPLTLTDDPIAVAAGNVRDYQLARLGTRLYVRVLIGGTGGGSLVRAFSIDLVAAAASRQTWRREELLEGAALPGGRWRLIGGFGEDGKAMLAVSDASGALYRFVALDVPNATGSLDFPRAGRPLDPGRLQAFRDAVPVNVQGVLVALGADVTYNPQTNAWTAGSTGIADLAGGVAAYRSDVEPRLWAIKRDGRQLTLAVPGPRLFSRDYFDQAQDTTLDVLSRRTSLLVLAPRELAWRSEPPGRVVVKQARPADYGCNATAGGRVRGIEAIVEIDHDDRPPTIFGKAGGIDVVLRRADNGDWRPVSSDDCVSVRATTSTAP